MTLSFLSIIYYYTDHQKRSILSSNEHTIHELTGSVLQSLQTIMLAGYADIAQDFANNLKRVPNIVDFRIVRKNGMEAFRDNNTIKAVNKHQGTNDFLPRSKEQTISVLDSNSEHLLELINTKQYVSYYENEGTDDYSLTYLAPILNKTECHDCHSDKSELRGLIKLTISMIPVLEEINSALYRSLTIALFVVLVMLLVTRWLVNRLVGKQVINLTAAMQEAASGNLEIKIPVDSKDELGNMADSFNTMITGLNQANLDLRREVSDRKLAESALYENEQRLKAVVDNVFNALITIDQNGHIISFNPSAEKIFGYSADEVINKNVNIIVEDTHRSSHDRYIQDFITHGEKTYVIGQTREVNGVHKDGHLIQLELTVTEFVKENARYFVGTMNDITERKEAERKLESTKRTLAHQEKMSAIGSLASGIVHEVGNPLAAISGLVEKVNEDIDDINNTDADKKTAKEDLSLIVEHINRLLQVIRDVSEFSSYAKTEKALLDLNGLVGQTCRLMRYDKRMRSIHLELDLDDSLPAVFGSENSLIQVLVNLIQNAIDAFEGFEGRSASILVKTRLFSDQILLTVSDNGMGMDENTLSQVFDTFFTTKPVNKGTGLGLSVCYSIIEEHKGTIEFESTLEKGTTCQIVLPVEAA
jgi:PAS domain S-box-containing protein